MSDLAFATQLAHEAFGLLTRLHGRGERELEACNEWLRVRQEHIEFKREVELITVLRSTFSFRYFLAEWSPLRDAVLLELTRRHGEAEARKLMYGLLGEVTSLQLPSV